MAKLSFNKLGLKPNNEIKIIEFNEQSIEVKQYLPIEEKLEFITNVLEASHDSNNFPNPVKIKAFSELQIIEKYTNISFTEKQKENIIKTYDMICGSDLISKIIETIPQQEYDALMCGVHDTIKAVYDYQNSVLGILDAITTDYDNLNLDITEIQKKLNDPNTLPLLKDVMTKLG